MKTGVVHLLRETARAGSVALCRVACSDDTFRSGPSGSLEGFASGWWSDVTCTDCVMNPVPWKQGIKNGPTVPIAA